MNTDDLEDFFLNCPFLYHMAQIGSWPMIREHGLLCTDQLLELFGIDDDAVKALTTKRRPTEVTVTNDALGTAVVRDQIPLLDSDLDICLLDGLTPTEWHKLLNERVFFWTNEERLYRLTGAGAYRNRSHDVLTLDTRLLFDGFSSTIELSPMNSGCTRPWRHKRGKDTFLSIASYPYNSWRKKRKKDDVIAEVTVIGGVSPILNLVTEVRRIKGSVTEEVLYVK